ncbi:MAG: glycosyltransferase family 87 protein [Chloroflexota bacterium]
MKWIKKLGCALNENVGTNLVALLLVVGFCGFGWQAIRPLVFNADMYDFNSYYLSAYASQHGLDPYNFDTLKSLAKELGIRKVTEYRYPPFYTFLFLPLSFLPYSAADLLWRVLNLALVGFAGWLIGKTLSLKFDAKNVLVLGLIFFNYDPLIYNLAIGQINLVILILLTGAAYAWTRQHAVRAGILLALGASIKLAPAVFFAYFLCKRGWRLVAAGLAAMLAFAALGYVALGEQTTRTFIAIVTSFAQEDNAWIGNQALRGFLSRLFVGDEFVRAAYPAPTLERVLYYTGALAIAALTAFVLYRARRTNAFHLEFALVLIAFHLVSPTSWVHHLVWTIYPLVVLALACLDRENLAPTVCFGIGYALIGFTLDYRNELLFQWPQALWLSTKFYGLAILYGVNAWLLLKPAHGVSAPE